jgi:hypothetical protein
MEEREEEIMGDGARLHLYILKRGNSLFQHQKTRPPLLLNDHTPIRHQFRPRATPNDRHLQGFVNIACRKKQPLHLQTRFAPPCQHLLPLAYFPNNGYNIFEYQYT